MQATFPHDTLFPEISYHMLPVCSYGKTGTIVLSVSFIVKNCHYSSVSHCQEQTAI